MDSYGRDFLLAFLPLFVAIDAIGTLPIVLGIVSKSPIGQALSASPTSPL